MPDVPLSGCTPEPLMGYLKALGILRLVGDHLAETRPDEAPTCGAWRSGIFVLRSPFNLDELVGFFLDLYEPTPIVAPWAGGSGFFGQDNRKAVDAIAASTVGRMARYRAVIGQVRAILIEEGQIDKPADESKSRLLRRYRRELPDEFVDWMDSALVLQAEGQVFPPLLGTGGNDGRLDFTQNFMQRLVEVGLAADQPASASGDLLRQSLTAQPVKGLLSAAVGQFDPGRAGGPNATQGLEGESLVNPWDYILMLEGSLLLAGSVARRLGASGRERASFPFTVRRASPVGFGSAADEEGATARGEIWLPLWDRFASLGELRALFSEGRAELAGHHPRDGVDFAQAVAGLGVDRGITSFIRFGFLKRSGKSFVAAPLGYFDVPRDRNQVDLLRELDGWLESFRRAAHADGAPPRFASVARRIDEAIFEYCRQARPDRMAAILRALGQAERELAGGEKFRQTDARTIHPVPSLNPAWLEACDDGSIEFRLARSLAFIRGANHDLDFRKSLEPVGFDYGRWQWDATARGVVWSRADLASNLLAVLTRRLLDVPDKDGEQGQDDKSSTISPLKSQFSAGLGDLTSFLNKETDDRRIEEFLWGMILIRHEQQFGRNRPIDDEADSLPRVYAMLKLLYLDGGLSWPHGAEPTKIRPEPEVLGRLRAGDLDGACRIASRRLVASGFIPFAGRLLDGRRRPSAFTDVNLDPIRLAASLIFPVPHSRPLAALALRPKAD